MHPKPIYFFPHFVSSVSPIVPPEIVSPSTGLPRKMILVFSWYPFGPNLFQALHGASTHVPFIRTMDAAALTASKASLGSGP